MGKIRGLAGAFVVLALASAAWAQSSSPPQSPPPATTKHKRGVVVLDPEASAPAETAPPEPDAVPPPPPPEPPVKPVKKVCNRAFPTADLTFYDDADFDRALSAKLKASHEPPGVVVDGVKFTPDHVPARLRAWFGEIDSSGGKVGRKDIPCGRGFSLFSLLHDMFAPPAAARLRAAARDYDATLWLEPASGEVTQVQFIRRNP